MKKSLLCCFILLSGCAHLNDEFDCPAVQGMGCQRLSTINETYNAAKGISNQESVTKSNHIDVYFEGYEDEQGAYHHPRKITIKT